MEEKIRSGKGAGWIILAVLLILAGLGTVGLGLWVDAQPKFQSITVELGTESLTIRQLMTKFAREDKASFVTDPAGVDLGRVGEYTLTLCHGGREETVTVTVTDTTLPAVQFRDVTLYIDQTCAPEDFVTDAYDLSGVTLSFGTAPELPADYADTAVTVIATDASGNSVTGECKVVWLWMRQALTLELGTTLTKEDVLLNPAKDAELLRQEDLDAINASPAGEYTLSGGGASCTVTVVDTTGPELTLQPVEIMENGTVELGDFVVSASDLSGAVDVKFVTEPELDRPGLQTVSVSATDAYGNVTTVQTQLLILGDTVAPTISGLGTLQVTVGTAPNYTYGVSAEDDRDGAVEFTYDASGVDISKAGTYYAVYTATDNSGNVATYKRKVIVAAEAVSTDELVASIAKTLGNDPLEIRNYVRKTIWYSSNWGGDDPVRFGFTKKHGNCYVHALCLQVLLEYKGYETQLIWVTAPEVAVESHYWLLIKLDGRWWHIDATPGTAHSKYDLMNDEQRYETLVREIDGETVQRDWDRSRWPACP